MDNNRRDLLNWIRKAVWFTRRMVLIYAILGLDGVSRTNAQEIAFDSKSQINMVDINGELIEWTDRDQIRVFCFLGVECPVARFYASRIDAIAKRFSEQRICFVGINSNLHDSASDLQRFANELELSFRQVKDNDQSLARAFGATRTAEVVVTDQNQRVLYRGRVDDQYAPGVKRSAATHNELEDALIRLLDGKSPETPRTEPVGCLITFDKKVAESASVTYCKQVAPILYQHCYECHRPNEIGPFDVSNFDELRGWADMVVEVIEQKRMPPWHATDTEYSFKNARHLPSESLKVIKQWARDGAPYGSASDLPKLPETMNGWRLPKSPDLVVAMRDRPYTIAASGAIDYQYFVVDPKITQDRWVSAAQVIPGNASVVHHAIVFIRPPDGVESNGVGWLTAFCAWATCDHVPARLCTPRSRRFEVGISNALHAKRCRTIGQYQNWRQLHRARSSYPRSLYARRLGPRIRNPTASCQPFGFYLGIQMASPQRTPGHHAPHASARQIVSIDSQRKNIEYE